MSDILIKNGTIVNEGKSTIGDILIKGDKIVSVIRPPETAIEKGTLIIDATGLLVLPGIIDTHVHFREPGLTHKADIQSETMAAVAGGVTSFMDMPNTDPPTITLDSLEKKSKIGGGKSLINYSFYLGATNDNPEELENADPKKICGIKLFLGSSTGNMLVNNESSLKRLFKIKSIPIVSHCEDENTIRKNSILSREKYGEMVPMDQHPIIRSRTACFLSSSHAINMAREYGTKLHILHLTTADELKLFSNTVPLREKRITSESCIAHLWYDDSFYDSLGTLIKVNPAIKTRFDRDALIKGLRDDIIDTIATDHAPHNLNEKNNTYFKSPSGAPVIQHSLVAMLELWHNKLISIEKIIEKMCHNPAIIFNIKERGYLREGYKADICLVNPDNPWKIHYESNILHKCGWSVFPDKSLFRSRVVTTIVNGNIVFENGKIDELHRGERLCFDR